jgi:hypothetical protein
VDSCREVVAPVALSSWVDSCREVVAPVALSWWVDWSREVVAAQVCHEGQHHLGFSYDDTIIALIRVTLKVLEQIFCRGERCAHPSPRQKICSGENRGHHKAIEKRNPSFVR